MPDSLGMLDDPCPSRPAGIIPTGSVGALPRSV